MSDFLTQNLSEFCEKLAAKQPVPGGGGAAALAGALAAALNAMVGEYTSGKEKYKAHQEEIEICLKDANQLKTALLSFIEEDAKAFEPLSKAYALKADNPQKEELLENATKEAITAPLAMLKAGLQVTMIARIMQTKGSIMLLSDAGCAAALCKASMQAAAMNVWINTKALKDKAYAKHINEEVDALLKEALPIADLVIEEVSKNLKTIDEESKAKE